MRFLNSSFGIFKFLFISPLLMRNVQQGSW